MPIAGISTGEPSFTVFAIAAIVGASFTLVTLKEMVEVLLSPSEFVALKVKESVGASEPLCL